MPKNNIVMSMDNRIIADGGTKKGVLYIYDEIKPDRVMYDGSKIPSDTSEKAIRDNLKTLEGVSELDVHISSRGGDVQTGFNIYAQLAAFKCPVKRCYIDGIAASVATMIAMACNTVTMSTSGLMMIHNAACGVYGNSEMLRKTADDLDIINAAAKKAYLTHAGDKLTEEKLTELMNAESWLTAESCMEYGLADSIGFAEDEHAPEGFTQCLKNSVSMSEGADAVMSERMTSLETKLDKVMQLLSAGGTDKLPEPQSTGKGKSHMMSALLKSFE